MKFETLQKKAQTTKTLRLSKREQKQQLTIFDAIARYKSVHEPTVNLLGEPLPWESGSVDKPEKVSHILDRILKSKGL